MTKYPYIPDKKMYAAVMGACKWIREEGYFNKAVSYYAEKYNVDPDELAKHIRARQSAGQKGKTGRTYKYYLVDKREQSYGETHYYNAPVIIKATSAKNAERQFYLGDSLDMQRSFESTGTVIWHETIGEYDSKGEAEEALRLFKEKNQ